MATEVKIALTSKRNRTKNKFIIQSNLAKNYTVHDPIEPNSLEAFF